MGLNGAASDRAFVRRGGPKKNANYPPTQAAQARAGTGGQTGAQGQKAARALNLQGEAGQGQVSKSFLSGQGQSLSAFLVSRSHDRRTWRARSLRAQPLRAQRSNPVNLARSTFMASWLSLRWNVACWPGVARRQVTFFCFAKRKVTKERRPHIPALRVPESRVCRAGGEELAPLLLDV
jgi:hypothetical protein